MLRHATGIQSYPLKAGSTDAPVPVAGVNTTFQLDSLPVRVGRLAYYMPAIVVTIKGTLTQPGGGPSIQRDVLMRLLFDSLELRNCWHGTPIKSSYFLGAFLPVIEYVGCGYRYGSRQKTAIPAAAAAYPFGVTFVIPLCVGTNVKPMQTAQLALFYREAELVLNMAATSVLTTFAPGASMAFTNMKASAMLYPHKDIWVAPGSEWILFESTSSVGQNRIELKSFGNETGLNGVDQNAGMLGLLACSSGAGMGGSFLPSTITQYNFPWRGQIQNNHPESIFVAQTMLSMGQSRNQQVGDSSSVNVSDYAGQPFVAGNTTDASQTADLENLYGVWLVQPQLDMELSKVQLAYGNPAYFLSATFAAGNNRTLAWQLKSFTREKLQDAAAQINGEGLAKAVLGKDITGYKTRGYGGSMMAHDGDDRFLPTYFG